MQATAEDQRIQDHLADVFTAGVLLHGLASLEAEVRALAEEAHRQAAAAGVAHSLIATAAGVTRSRVSQIVSGPASMSSRELRDALGKIYEYPGDALARHDRGFGGVMTYPPYTRPVTRWVPTISRKANEYEQEDGRLYGETVDTAEQEQADRRYWFVGAEVREGRNPLVVAVNGKIRRVHQVDEWIQEPGQTKWTALGSGTFAKDERRPKWLPSWWPAEFMPGEKLARPNRQGAYTPAKITPDGVIHRSTKPE